MVVGQRSLCQKTTVRCPMLEAAIKCLRYNRDCNILKMMANYAIIRKKCKVCVTPVQLSVTPFKYATPVIISWLTKSLLYYFRDA